MSNRRNKALADAWLVADQAAVLSTFEKEKKQAQKLWEQRADEVEVSMREYEADRGMWGDIGSYIGSAVGTATGFVLGGPAGALKGAMQGYQAGDELAEMIYDINPNHIKDVKEDYKKIDAFDYQFSNYATKYKNTQNLEDVYKETEKVAVDNATRMIEEDFLSVYDLDMDEDLIKGITSAAADWHKASKTFDTFTAGFQEFGESKIGDFLGFDRVTDWATDWQSSWDLAQEATSVVDIANVVQDPGVDTLVTHAGMERADEGLNLLNRESSSGFFGSLLNWLEEDVEGGG